MRLSDRGLGELGLLFGLIGVAGVGVPVIWPDEKGVGIAFVLLGGIGFIVVAIFAFIRVCRERGVKLGLALAMIGTFLIVLGGIVGMVGAFKIDAQDEQNGPRAGAETRPRGPTLEATNRSTIDATGATIPGDLPFQFGRADSDSLIAMPGIKVTKTDGGWEVTLPENVNYHFPSPPPEYAAMPTPELRRQLQATANDLRAFQLQFTAAFRQVLPDIAKANEVGETYRAEYEKRFLEPSFSLASAAMSRIGTITLPKTANSGSQIVYYKKFVGPTAAGDAATFLEALSEGLN
jgi:hypothetical protein